MELQTAMMSVLIWEVAVHGGGLMADGCNVAISAANRLIGEVVQSRRRPLIGPSPG